jgi:hypothetical protein
MTVPEPFHFSGFAGPRYTQTPDELFDVLLPVLSGAELKVLLYIIRRTFGWRKDADTISLSQIMHGITKADGTPLDHGTGLAKSTAIAAIKGLEAKGIIEAVRSGNTGARGFETTSYRPRLAAPLSDNPTSLVQKSDLPLVRESDIQQTDVTTYNKNGSEPGLSERIQLETEIRTFAGRCRQNVTPEQVAALAARAGTLARWQAVSAGAGSLQDVQRALGEG